MEQQALSIPTGQPSPRAPKPIRDPAYAVAVAKCYLAHSGTMDSYHPDPCRFCGMTQKRKIEALHEYRLWPGCVEAEDIFGRMSRDRQKELVEKAQGVGQQELFREQLAARAAVPPPPAAEPHRMDETMQPAERHTTAPERAPRGRVSDTPQRNAPPDDGLPF